MVAYPEYLWIAVCGSLCGLAYAFLIGANDVANAFASSVSSKSLTLKQAVVCAAIFEFSGALFLGASVTSTIRSKIIDIELYEDQPDVLMFGMFTSLFSASIMLFVATYYGLPVSTTHDIVGCIMGFSIAAKGFSSVEWDVAKKLFISWVASPLIAGTGGFIFFAFVKYVVMKSNNPFQRAYYTFPLVLLIGIGIDLFYTLCKCRVPQIHSPYLSDVISQFVSLRFMYVLQTRLAPTFLTSKICRLELPSPSPSGLDFWPGLSGSLVLALARKNESRRHAKSALRKNSRPLWTKRERCIRSLTLRRLGKRKLPHPHLMVEMAPILLLLSPTKILKLVTRMLLPFRSRNRTPLRPRKVSRNTS